MRRFSHFLFEAYEPEQAAQNPLDPRCYQTKATDACLSSVADGLTVAEGAQTLMDLGLLRKENGRLLLIARCFSGRTHLFCGPGWRQRRRGWSIL